MGELLVYQRVICIFVHLQNPIGIPNQAQQRCMIPYTCQFFLPIPDNYSFGGNPNHPYIDYPKYPEFLAFFLSNKQLFRFELGILREHPQPSR